MIEVLKEIILGALRRLVDQARSELPPLLAALTILLIAILLAKCARMLMTRLFKGITADRWLQRSGISSLIDRSGTLRASRVAAEAAYWTILLLGCVAALNAFGNQITVRIAEAAVLLVPRLVAAGLIILAGFWIGQYSGRSALVWAVNRGLPFPRDLACLVRRLVVFAAIVVAAETAGFAGTVFLAAFLLVVGAIAFAAALAIGPASRDVVRNLLARPGTSDFHGAGHEGVAEHSTWNHL